MSKLSMVTLLSSIVLFCFVSLRAQEETKSFSGEAVKSVQVVPAVQTSAEQVKTVSPVRPVTAPAIISVPTTPVKSVTPAPSGPTPTKPSAPTPVTLSPSPAPAVTVTPTGKLATAPTGTISVTGAAPAKSVITAVTTPTQPTTSLQKTATTPAAPAQTATVPATTAQPSAAAAQTPVTTAAPSPAPSQPAVAAPTTAPGAAVGPTPATAVPSQATAPVQPAAGALITSPGTAAGLAPAAPISAPTAPAMGMAVTPAAAAPAPAEAPEQVPPVVEPQPSPEVPEAEKIEAEEMPAENKEVVAPEVSAEEVPSRAETAPVEQAPAPAAPVPQVPAEVSPMPQAPQPPEVAKVSKEKAPAPSVASEEFDTSKIKEYGGNWYFKRAWWQNAEGEYEKARQVLEQLFEVRMVFFEKRNELQRALFEPFYRNIGFEQGELKDTLVYLIDQIEGARETEGSLDIKQREFLSVLAEEKKTLEQLKLDMDQFAKFDDAINNAIDLLIKEINQARQYEQTSWREFKAIAEDLSDIKARERYYTIRTLYKDIKNINDYVRGDFKRYFDNLADVAHKEADRIKTTVAALKSKGIDLKLEAKKLAEEPSKAVPAPVCGIPEEQPGYFMAAVYWVGGVLKSIWNLIFGWMYRF